MAEVRLRLIRPIWQPTDYEHSSFLEPRGGTVNQSRSLFNSLYGDQLKLAERERSAFIAAVAAMFGPEQARHSAEDWLNATEQMFGPYEPTGQDWRRVTIVASARLACRLATELPHRNRPSAIDQYEGIADSIPSSGCFTA
jgi:hypothetical protein